MITWEVIAITVTRTTRIYTGPRRLVSLNRYNSPPYPGTAANARQKD